MNEIIWNFNTFAGRVAFLDENGEALTYQGLEQEAGELARIIGRRCLVFILCKNSIGSVLGYVAALNHGIVPVMLNKGIDKQQLDKLMGIYSPAFLWLPSDEKNQYGNAIYESHGYSLVKTEYVKEYQLYGGLALLLTTSGSTGSPKFVRQSYGNIKANTESIIEYLGLDLSERPITTLPMNYTYGLSIINTHLSVGSTILLTDRSMMQKEFWRFFKEEGATSFGGVPYTYEMLDKLRIYRMDLPSLRTMTQAGGKLTPELHEKFALYAQDTGRNFVVMYGQCEATARMGYLPADKAVEKKGSMGIAIPGGKFTLVDVEGREIRTPHTVGELVYEGANVTLGYAECGDGLIKPDERSGRLATGDMAEFDEDGYYYIVGRKKRFLKIYGNRVNLDELDRLIKGKFGIDAICAGIDDHAYIFLTEGGMTDDVREYVVKTTGLNPAAFKVKVIDKIPKNDSGKTQYTGLERYYDEV